MTGKVKFNSADKSDTVSFAKNAVSKEYRPFNAFQGVRRRHSGPALHEGGHPRPEVVRQPILTVVTKNYETHKRKTRAGLAKNAISEFSSGKLGRRNVDCTVAVKWGAAPIVFLGAIWYNLIQ